MIPVSLTLSTIVNTGSKTVHIVSTVFWDFIFHTDKSMKMCVNNDYIATMQFHKKYKVATYYMNVIMHFIKYYSYHILGPSKQRLYQMQVEDVVQSIETNVLAYDNQY